MDEDDKPDADTTQQEPSAEESSGGEPSQEELLEILKTLKNEHRRIDNEIKALDENGVTDMLKIRRMKKIKLSLKDQITYTENMITPDIIA